MEMQSKIKRAAATKWASLILLGKHSALFDV
jgi:hypothetical protein